MIKFLFKLNPTDNYQVENINHEINLSRKEDFESTFFNRFRKLYKMPDFFKNQALDLFYLSFMVYYADRLVEREGTYDNWTRNFELHCPVLDLEKWNTNKALVEKMLSFLSGDIWKLEFRQRELNEKETYVSERLKNRYVDSKISIDGFCMLSGGLDSFVGAINLLSLGNSLGFVGHYGGGKGVKPYQDIVNSLLQENFSISENNFFNFYAAPIGGLENTTRTRSFLFFTHAIVLSSCFNKRMKVYIPENGLISLNIPLTNTRLGSGSTRTTHPYYLQLFQELLNNLEIDVELDNPFQFMTKGEMLTNCENINFLKNNYTQTMSCSHPDLTRYKGGSDAKHCGTCLPCTIRRASVLAAFGDDGTEYEDINFEMANAKHELRSFKLGLYEYEKTKNNKFISLTSGNLNYNQTEFSGLYERGMLELKTFLDTINE